MKKTLEQSAESASSDHMIENRTYDEIVVGESASLARTVTQTDIELFAVVSGDVNPAHMDPAYAETRARPLQVAAATSAPSRQTVEIKQTPRLGDDYRRPVVATRRLKVR